MQWCIFLDECKPAISSDYKEESLCGTTSQTYKMQCLFTMFGKKNVYIVNRLSKAYGVTIKQNIVNHTKTKIQYNAYFVV